MTDKTHTEDDAHFELRQSLSELVDGEADAHTVSHLSQAWREHDEARAAWHCYQLIGDVLRSPDLASTAQRDEAFLQSLRARLAQEPPWVAPQSAAVEVAEPVVQHEGLQSIAPPAVAGRKRRVWAIPAGVAASVLAVFGGWNLWHMGGAGGGALMADAALTGQGTRATPILVSAPSGAVPSLQDAPQYVMDGQLIRDARLDRYLAAHKPLGGGTAAAMQAGWVPSAPAGATH